MGHTTWNQQFGFKNENAKLDAYINCCGMFALMYTIKDWKCDGRKKEKLLPQWEVDETILRLQICPRFYVSANHENRVIWLPICCMNS